MNRFEDLVVWQQSRELTKEVYSITGTFPAEERFGITNQLRRAVVSISSNIAEGSGRLSPKEQKHFYSMAFGSLSEVLCQLILTQDLGFLLKEDLIRLREKISVIGKQLSKLSASTERN